MILGLALYSLTKRNTLLRVLLSLQGVAIMLLPEILLLFYLAQLYGKLLILAIVCATSLGGLYLITNSIFHATKKMQGSITDGVFRKNEFGILYTLLLCGLLLILPGFITDIIGLFIYLPPIRLMVSKIFTQRLSADIRQAYCYNKLYS